MSSPEYSGRKDRSLSDRKPLDPTDWLDQYGDVLFRYAVVRVRRREVAEELVQETMLAALNARAQFSGQSKVGTWLVGILKHKIVDYYRQVERQRRVEESQSDDFPHEEMFSGKGHWRKTLGKWPHDPAEALEQAEFWQVLDRCLSKLPKRLAQAFLLREGDQMSTAETCKILDISTSNLAVRLYRARLLLRRCLENNWFEQNDSRG